MYRSCDVCHETLHRDEDGWWVDDNNESSTFHNGQPHTHSVDGKQC